MSTAGEPPSILQAKNESLEELLMPSPEEITKKTWWQFWKH
jgi:hypothetical protein